MTDEDLAESTTAEMTTALESGFILPVHWDIVSIVSVVGTIQLALRHPDFQLRPTSAHVREIADQIIDRVESEGFHATAASLRRGYDPNHDE